MPGLEPYDAIMLLSYGGPNGMDDVPESPTNAYSKSQSTMSVSVEFRPLMPVISA